jgi:hypothetical protein
VGGSFCARGTPLVQACACVRGARLRACVRACVRASMSASTLTFTHTHARTHTNTHARTHARTHIGVHGGGDVVDDVPHALCAGQAGRDRAGVHGRCRACCPYATRAACFLGMCSYPCNICTGTGPPLPLSPLRLDCCLWLRTSCGNDWRLSRSSWPGSPKRDERPSADDADADVPGAN